MSLQHFYARKEGASTLKAFVRSQLTIVHRRVQQKCSKHSPALVPDRNLSHFYFQMYDASCTKTLSHDDVKT